MARRRCGKFARSLRWGVESPTQIRAGLFRYAQTGGVMDDDETTMTSVSMEVGQVSVTITTSAGWTPEMVEDSLIRMQRQIVAAVRKLGLVATAEDTE